MERKNEPDKLAQDAAAARAAGMTYGKWKAMQVPVVIEPKKPKEYFIKRICAECNVEFVTFDNRIRKYCGDKCRNRAHDRTRREKAMGAE